MSLQGPAPKEPGGQDTTAQLKKFGVPAILGLFGLIFILQNLETIGVSFLWFDFRAQLWLLLVIFACIGAALFWGISRRRAARRAKAAE
jgi:uncharacterized integral membrane protein